MEELIVDVNHWSNQRMRITIEQPPLTSLVKGQVVQVESITQDAFPQEGYVTQYKLKN